MIPITIDLESDDLMRLCRLSDGFKQPVDVIVKQWILSLLQVSEERMENI